jgi:small-conductance mechanosensitive channel
VTRAKTLTARKVSAMTDNQSRRLKVGDRVRWGDSATDSGTVAGTAWNEVTIKWDDGRTTVIPRSDMSRVEQLPRT